MLRPLPILIAAAATLLTSCVAGPAPRNRPASAWMPAQDRTVAAQVCRAASFVGAATGLHRITANAFAQGSSLVAPGDRLRLRLGSEDDRLSGVYVIDPAGRLSIPGAPALAASGLDEAALLQRAAAAMVGAQIIRDAASVDLRLIESAGVTVAVSGAVFEPGSVRVGDRNVETRVGQREGAASGDANAGRSVAAALRAAGGVRPDADVARIALIRGSDWAELDLSEVALGLRAGDIPVAAGDRLVVGSSNCFHADLVRQSAITAPGIRVYMSNLSRPGNNNAGSAITKDATSLPYGTRMLQALVAMNCVGGSAMNVHRHGVLISHNPVNGQSVVVERAVETLVRAADRDDHDPYLMPGDALACYDSRTMNVADAVGLVVSAANAVTPALLLSRVAQ